MGQTKNSFSGLLAQFMRLETNALTIVGKLSEAVTSSKDTVEFSLTSDDGINQIYQVPSFGALKANIDRIDKTIQGMAGLGDSNAKVRLPDGTYKTIYLSSIAKDPKPIGNVSTPTKFQTRSNWFFESFLNPLLYVEFDISAYVDPETERVRVLRLLCNTDNTDKIAYFDNNIKGRNDLDYEKTLEELQKRNISWSVDDEIVPMDPSVARYSGTFDVINVIEDEVPTLISGQTVNVKNRLYRVHKLTYTDNLETVTDNKVLKSGDTLLVGENTKYLIESVDSDKYLIKVKRISGYDSIKIGIGTLEIYSPTFAKKEIDVNVGFDERQVVFLKPIDPKFEIIATKWSPGIGFYSNELIINTSSGNKSLDDYYKEEVVDFGTALLSIAKERPVSSVLGEQPDSPILAVDNFKVVQVNTHKTNTKDLEEIKKLQSEKTNLLSEIGNIDTAIDKKKLELNSTNFQSDTDRKAATTELDNLIKNKGSKTNLYTSIVNDLVTKTKDKNPDDFKPKYRVRGFWPFPEPKQSDKTNPQEVIQFVVSYRYLRPDGGTAGTEEIKFTDPDGTERRGTFSNWNEYKTDIRKKLYNETTGFFEWAVEDVEDADAPNINQLDISISKGEKVEVKIKSLSEAGWPVNPIESEWSEAVIIPFPEDLGVGDDNSSLIQQSNAEQSRITFQQELNSKGLDLHLLGSFTAGDKYYAHTTNDISSGFFTSEGNVINLFEKLKSMQASIDNLNNLISNAKGTLAVYLLDGINKTQIANNTTTSLFAGFYDEEANTQTGIRGEIITKVWNIQLENSSASTLELISQIPGALEEILGTAETTSYNYEKRRYDKVPIVLSSVDESSVTNKTGVKQPNTFQSAQVKSQFVYSRFKDVGLSNDLYRDTNLDGSAIKHRSYYPYFGTSDETASKWIDGVAAAETGLPFATIWNGNFTGSSPTGNGAISEFSVPTSHPYFQIPGIPTNKLNTLFPSPTSTSISLPPFVMSKLASVDKYQADYKAVTTVTGTYPVVGTSGNTNEATFENNYPVKYGFKPEDKYLIGRRTCGAYLYLAPSTYSDILVPGSDSLAKKSIEFGIDNKVSIPLVFQYRLRDFHPDDTNYPKGFAGGWNVNNSEPSQIAIEKTIGIDILPNQSTLFSFDFKVSCKLKKDKVII